MEIGSTFSHIHLKNMGVNISDAVKEYKTLGMEWLRLGCYWSHIERTKKSYDFSEIDKVVEEFEKSGIKIIMTVGMKAPRWPEYFIPEWQRKELNVPKNGIVDLKDTSFSKNVLEFIRRCVERYKVNKSIKVWQIENEPLDPSGELGIHISENLLRKEIECVKSIDKTRKTLVTVWGNELTKRGCFKIANSLADIVGVNLYLRRPIKRFGLFEGYSGPNDSSSIMIREIDYAKKQGKDIWITELQAEPWEEDNAVTKITDPPSFLPTDFQKNVEYGAKLGPSLILLWGYEWWYYRKINGDNRYWEEAKRIISQRILLR